MAENPTIVITGMGAVTPLGPTFSATWNQLLQGLDAAGPVTAFDASGCRCQQAAEARFPEWSRVPASKRRRWVRASRMAVPAAAEALHQAGLLDDQGQSLVAKLPLSVSTTGGGMSLGESFLRQLHVGSPGPKNQFFRVARYSAQQQVLDMQEALGFRGPVMIVANACASGANAIGHARDLIRRGETEIVLTGGFEALTELIYVGFDCLHTMATDRCRPFDQHRTGLMLGEAAAFLVLETEAHARARGAEILGVLAGYGHGTDLHHLTQPDPTGSTQVRVMTTALAEAGISADAVSYVNAHGTGTKLNDASECAAFESVFNLSDNPQTPWISSTKSAIGHTLGAAGAIEALFAIQALRTGDLPPQLNLQEPEPAVARRLVTAGTRVEQPRAMMSVNLGFGGSNAALVFTPYRPADQPDVTAVTGRAPALQRTGQEIIAITGLGAVSPCGCGVDALLRPEPVAPTTVTGLTGHPHQAMTVNIKQGRLGEWPLHPRVRRASAIACFMLEAAQQAIEQAGPIDPARLGIVACYGSGALILSRKFYEGILKNGQRFAAPNLFPETVFNSPSSHLAAVLEVSGPCYSVVGDETAWVTGLGVAAGWLRDHLVDHAVVVGTEELDPVILDAYAAGRLAAGNPLFAGAEGAGAVVLQRHSTAGTNALARVDRIIEGFTYRNRAQAWQAARDCAQAIGPGTRVYPASQQTWMTPIETDIFGNPSPSTNTALPYCGFAFAASAAWHTIRAVATAAPSDAPVAVPVCGVNEQCAALILAPGNRRT